MNAARDWMKANGWPDDELIQAVCEEAWGIDYAQESGNSRRFFYDQANALVALITQTPGECVAGTGDPSSPPGG